MGITEEEKKQWEKWLSERPIKVKEVAEKIVPWKEYRHTQENETGNRYIPVSYYEHEDGTVTVECYKSNEFWPFLGGYNVFGMNPNYLVEL